MKPIIGFSIGDINGIGPEILLKTFDDNRLLEICTPIIFGNTKVLSFYKKSLPDCNLQLNGIKDLSAINPKQVNVLNCWEEDVEITPGIENASGGKYAIKSLLQAAQALKDGLIKGLVTLPISKNNTQIPEFPYTGHTPFFKKLYDASDVLMLLCTDDLKVALLTEHVPISEIASAVTKENITNKIELFQASLQKDFGINKPKIAILALNPHAGDGGLIGKEERDIIKPTIESLQAKGINAYGPYAADGFFARQHDAQFDGVLAMYHDQGLIPFKSFDKAQGVNYTAGLLAVRTSPDHGTAFDIAGKGKASTSSFLQALYTCIDIINQREAFSNATANPLKRNQLKDFKKTKQ
jgi:4-hydroxythreonine-4-phosphate dehydrogenase